jgi:signal transduction histidine kinase
VQEKYNFRKLIAVPLIAERTLVGGLVGLTNKDWLTDDEIAAFERYADQVALVLDNALLIEKLRNKNVELERVSRVKSEFLATMSHELRTPLTAIIGFSELLLEEILGDLSSDQKDSLKEVLNNAENLLQLINSLLDLAKIEAGKMELCIMPIDLGDIAERVHRTVAPLAMKKGHRFDVFISEDLPICYGDERKIQQTLLNLVSNAIKFTAEKGLVNIAVRFYPSIKGLKRWESAPDRYFTNGAFEILVADNGIGIDKRDLDYIFESFSQVDSSFTRNYPGTGLGLGLSQQFIRMHHGILKVESELGKGSTLCMLLPRGRMPSPSI